MYLENSEDKMNEAFVQCPIVQILDLGSGVTEALGNCEITVSPEDVVYAQMTCKGQVGICAGKFVLIDGEGRFAGISGEGELTVRSPIRALAADLGSGSLLRVGSGLATVKDLVFSVP